MYKLYPERSAGSDSLPRWLPKQFTETPCMVKDCNAFSRGETSITSFEVARRYLNLQQSQSSNPLVLCNAHYQHLYREVNRPLPCATCFLPPKPGERHTRKCPDPYIIRHYLIDTIGFDGSLTCESSLCKQCYVLHQKILRDQKECPTISYLISIFEQKLLHSNTAD